MIFDILSWCLFLLGALFIIAGSLGMLRFPDFYTRLHAAGVTDTLGVELMLLAMIFQSDNWITIVKLLLIALFMLLTSPVATHAIAHAAWVGKLKPMLGPDLRRDGDAETREEDA
ncbi:monovalent cation/H(+) antiporter subunit G [Parvularcula flava]|uniref:Monovalent cation/H(+) antiporter subunit G n=1 Tax=Aquisalinus luteolus TaxID=1566827 RepID=A0A8J3A468_9PROT|nr:monovalent cation/H(+) antiporter subunit G [Aquisalinus luteolus]NHK29558.1 monovalent cation/H(+) antiporter subunit G [Aquisalinus luteolus]GGI01581.1 sodium:proton antiporter [Aquisalinus luteolus]